MRYPLEKPTNIPGSGNALYLFLIEHVDIPAKLTHELWYKGCQTLVDDPRHPFQGFFPIGKTLCISYGGSEMQDYTFTGGEKNPVFVKDLSKEAKKEYNIPLNYDPTAKVFNPFFCEYEKLSEKVRKSNELPTLSLAKSIGSFLGSRDILFTEEEVAEMLIVSIKDCNSDQMKYILHSNHIAWCAARFMETGVMEEDIKKNFYGQNTIEFYIKDVNTIMPGILYCLAILGLSPVKMIENLTYDLWGINNVAMELEKCMKVNAVKKEV